MAEKSHSNFKLQNDKHFLIEYGSINKKNPEVIYVNYKTYLASTNKNENYRIILKDILKKFKHLTKNVILNSRFNDNFIFDYDILQDIQPMFKNKILTFELYLKQPEDDIIKITNLKQCIEKLSNELTTILIKDLHINNIELSKAKKN